MYVALLAVADSLGPITGVNFSVEAGGTAMDRATLARSKEVSFIQEVGASIYAWQTGELDMDVDGWGPQKGRLLWLTGGLGMGFAARADSGIKTIQDVRGKRLATFPGYPSIQAYHDAYLAFGGLTWNDVKPVPFAGLAQAYNALIAGTIDANLLGPDIAAAYELEASSHGLQWIPFPASDIEGWKRLQAIAPWFFPNSATSGAGASATKPAQIAAFAQGVLGYPWVDEDLAYWLTKAKTENYDAFKGKHNFADTFTLENAVRIDRALLPYHPGAIKYYREIGVWGAKEDAWQAQMLAQEPANIEAWKARHPTWTWKGE